MARSSMTIMLRLFDPMGQEVHAQAPAGEVSRWIREAIQEKLDREKAQPK